MSSQMALCRDTEFALACFAAYADLKEFRASALLGPFVKDLFSAIACPHFYTNLALLSREGNVETRSSAGRLLQSLVIGLTIEYISVHVTGRSVMRRTCLTIVACTAASIGFSFAQDNIKADTTEALGLEWQDSKNALHCLKALGLYTQYTPDPERAAKEALQELQEGDAGHKELFKVAQEQPDFLNWLASATPKSYKVPDDETLFTQAKAVIAKVYTGRLDALSDVHKSSQAQYDALALFQLLNTYRTSTITLDEMQTLRAAYKNPKRLFKIVDDRFDPPKS